MKKSLFCILLLFSVLAIQPGTISAAELKIGTAKTDITPPKVVPLWGQWHMRLSKTPQTPLTANIAAIESVENGKPVDSVIFVSLDLLQVSPDLRQAVHEKIVKKEPAIDPNKIVLSATHTHTAPVLSRLSGKGIPKKPEIISVDEILEFISTRLCDAIVKAWHARVPCVMSYGLDFAAVAQNRRMVYKDGSALMFGKTNADNFNHVEGVEDRDVNSIFFSDAKGKLLAIMINISCPSQVVGGSTTINADYWHPVREVLYKRFGSDITVLGLCGASGDLFPRPQFRQSAFSRMDKLRNLSPMEEIARKIDLAVADTWDAVKNEKSNGLPLIHKVKTVQLPMRLVTEAEYAEAKKVYQGIMDKLAAQPDKSAGEVAFMAVTWQKSVMDRYEAQKKNPKPLYSTVIHVIRLGDVAICTNQFELFTAYGIQMKAWSPAVQTLVVQLAGSGSYLPTAKAVRGGSYSAIIGSNLVGPEGGQVLVNETISLLNEMWPQKTVPAKKQ